MKNNEKVRGKRIMPIFLAIGILFAIGGWGAAACLYTASKPKVDTDILDKLKSNPLISIADSELLQAIEQRHSTRRGDFTGKDISADALQMLGWAATGVNRDGAGFVVPLAMGQKPYVSLYLAGESGVKKFSWETNDFEHIIDEDIRNKVNSGQNASAVWIYVIEKDKVPGENMDWAWHTIGAMSEHQYLVANELNIQARFMASIDADKLAALLKLDSGNSIPSGVMVMAQQ